MTTSIYVAIPVMLVLALIQTAVLPDLPILGLMPQLPFLVALAWGLLRTAEEGVVWAFVAGISVGLFSLAPLGLTALAYMGGVGLSLLLLRWLPPRRLSIAILLTAVGSAIYLTIYFIGLRLFGFGGSGGVAYELLPLILLHAVLIVPIYLLMAAILRALRPKRVEL